VGSCGLAVSDSGDEPMAGSNEHGYEPSSSIHAGKFFV
jgi:hypothetical protein